MCAARQAQLSGPEADSGCYPLAAEQLTSASMILQQENSAYREARAWAWLGYQRWGLSARHWDPDLCSRPTPSAVEQLQILLCPGQEHVLGCLEA